MNGNVWNVRFKSLLFFLVTTLPFSVRDLHRQYKRCTCTPKNLREKGHGGSTIACKHRMGNRGKFSHDPDILWPTAVLHPAQRAAHLFLCFPSTFSPRDENNNFTLRNNGKITQPRHALIDHSLCIYSNLLPVFSFFFFQTSHRCDAFTSARAKNGVTRATKGPGVCALGIIKKSTDRYRAWRLINMQRERALTAPLSPNEVSSSYLGNCSTLQRSDATVEIQSTNFPEIRGFRARLVLTSFPRTAYATLTLR